MLSFSHRLFSSVLLITTLLDATVTAVPLGGTKAPQQVENVQAPINYGSPYSLETLALNLPLSKPARVKAASIKFQLRAHRWGLQKRGGQPVKEHLQSHLFLDLSPEKGDYSLAHFEDSANVERVFRIFGNADTLIAETNKLLKARAKSVVEADPKYKLVHNLEDDLDYINTAMIFMSLFQPSRGNQLVSTVDLSHWKTRYEEFNRIRGFDTAKET
ncbi:hypothetical protein GGU11DRAFT_863434 [Lentinula aff. detonsa]|nr:hypothetical protein GGU11DRAFT_863434 [Lentinula aff. detonsa]